MLQIMDLQVFDGPSIYCHKPVVMLCLKLDEHDEKPSKDIIGLNEALRLYFPGLLDHECSKGYPGGFLERLKEGTYLPHIFEHLCLEIQSVLGYNVKYGKTRRIADDKYRVVFTYGNKQVVVSCIQFILKFLNHLLYFKFYDFNKSILKLKAVKEGLHPGPSTAAIMEEAIKRGIPVQEMHSSGVLRLGYGKNQRLVSATLYEGTSSVAVDLACDKHLAKALLDEVAIPTPKGQICLTIEEALQSAEGLGYPLVIKPKTGNHGNGVFIGIKDEDGLRAAFSQAKPLDEEVLIEKHINGRDYRLLVINGMMVAAAERIPPHVIGNGVHTVGELINMVNSSPERGEGHEKPLTKIKVDDNTHSLLKKQGMVLAYTPRINEVVWLRENSNLSTGGMAIDCTKKVHPTNKAYGELAARTLGLDIAGIDMIIPDISEPMEWGNGAIVEVNAAPGIRMHLYPTQGKPVNVAVPILDMIFPPGSSALIPITSVTGTNGKTTTVRMISHIEQAHGWTVGMTTTSGIYKNNECIEVGDTTGPLSAKRVLNNREVNSAVLETARGGIIRGGLGYRRADVAVFTNLSSDHLGVDGIDTMEDLLDVKALVIEAVKPEGYCILNADDPWVMKAKDNARGNVILFGMDCANFRNHLLGNGEAVYCDYKDIYHIKGNIQRKIMQVSDIPATLNGVLIHNIYNSMAAIAAAYAVHIPVDTIVSAMKSFAGDEHTNPGRFNIYELNGIKVVLDYGHNAEGYRVTIESLKSLNPGRLIGVIGVPGDRRDGDIREVGQLSAMAFDYIIIKEDKDLRGRKIGETSNILYKSVFERLMDPDRIRIIPDEQLALIEAMQIAQPGDAVIVFYDQLEPLKEIISDYRKHIKFRQLL